MRRPLLIALLLSAATLAVYAQTSSFEFIGYDGRTYGVPTVLQADSFAYLPEHTGELDSYAALFESSHSQMPSVANAGIVEPWPVSAGKPGGEGVPERSRCSALGPEKPLRM